MKYLALLCALTLAACSSSPNTTTHNDPQYSNTMDIIYAAAEARPGRVGGDYILPIRAAGSQGAVVFLNTEEDYRDPRAVTIALHPRLVQELTNRYGESPETYFVGKAVRVRGEAQTVQIDFNCESHSEQRYYYQTHIPIVDSRRLRVVAEDIE